MGIVLEASEGVPYISLGIVLEASKGLILVSICSSCPCVLEDFYRSNGVLGGVF